MRFATEQALRLVAAGVTPYRAAKLMGLPLCTIYRAIKREKARPIYSPASRERNT